MLVCRLSYGVKIEAQDVPIKLHKAPVDIIRFKSVLHMTFLETPIKRPFGGNASY